MNGSSGSSNPYGASTGYQPQQSTGYQPQTQSTGYGSGAGGYNPGLMPGMGANTQFQGGTPFWQPWVGWNESNSTSPTAQGGMDQGAAKAPGAPQWLQQQLGNYQNLPMYTNPNQYGRFNWGTNMQGGGIPSPFGQYAQQTAQYPANQFPPPPGQGGSGGAGGGGGSGGGQPPPPGGGGTPPPPPNLSGMNTGDLVRQWTYMGSNDPNRNALFNEIATRGGAANSSDAAQNPAAGKLINQYSAGGTGYDFQKSGDAYTNQMLNDPAMASWRAANPGWVAAATAQLKGK